MGKQRDETVTLLGGPKDGQLLAVSRLPQGQSRDYILIVEGFTDARTKKGVPPQEYRKRFLYERDAEGRWVYHDCDLGKAT